MLDRDVATAFIAELKRINRTVRGRFVVGGSYRRGLPKITDIDLMWVSNTTPLNDINWDSAKFKVIDRRGGNLHQFIDVVFNGHKFTVDLYATNKSDYPYMLAYVTGDRGETLGLRRTAMDKGWLLNQYGLWYRNRPTHRVRNSSRIRTEKQLYEFLGKTYKSPAQRDHGAYK